MALFAMAYHEMYVVPHMQEGNSCWTLGLAGTRLRALHCTVLFCALQPKLAIALHNPARATKTAERKHGRIARQAAGCGMNVGAWEHLTLGANYSWEP